MSDLEAERGNIENSDAYSGMGVGKWGSWRGALYLKLIWKLLIRKPILKKEANQSFRREISCIVG